MKKLIRYLSTAMSLLLAMSFCAITAGCNNVEVVDKKEPASQIGGFNLPYSAGQATEGLYEYDPDLFYLNETRLDGADPGALYTSEEDIKDSYEKLQRTWKYKDANGEYQWQNGKDQEKFEAEYGTLESWLEQYGNQYYLIVTGGGTGGAYPLWTSTDLFNWTRSGRAANGNAINLESTGWSNGECCWAPEFIRDPDSGLYFIFFSANSKNGNANTTYSANNSSTGYSYDGLQVSCAISTNPIGPYTLATAEEYLTHRAQKDENGNVITGTVAKPGADLDRDGQPDVQLYEIYDYAGNVIGYKGGGLYYTLNGYEITKETPVVNVGYYYPRLATNEEKIAQMEAKYHVTKGNWGLTYDNCVFPCIDVNPVIASDGTIMVYFSQHVSSLQRGNHIWCVKMKDFITPDWDTLTHVTTSSYRTVEDDGTFEGKLGEKTSNIIPGSDKEWEQIAWDEGTINEGTEVIEHNGKWYLTYSPFGYGSRQYSIYVAVSDNPTGPFEKLGLTYSPVIGIGTEYNDYMSGTGHHCFIKAGDELFILYHCFRNPENNNNNTGSFMGRVIGADRAYWKYTPALGYDMLYGNGPTYNLQPKPESFTGYTNVAKYATIEGNGDGDYADTSVLTDGLFTSQPFSRQWEYGRDDGHLTITLKWEKPVEITAFMIYNSGSIFESFNKVNSVLFKLYSKPAWYLNDQYNGYCYIKDLPTNPDDYNLDQNVVRKGASAMAQFEPITITEMTICISGDEADKYIFTDSTNVKEEYRAVRVAEIYVFGNEVE